MDTTEKVYCKRHPKTETALTCASCGTPICPKCMVVAPVGMKCRDCAKSKGIEADAKSILLAAITAIAAGVVLGVIGSVLPFLRIFVAIAYGFGAGQVILKASGMKRGIAMEIAAGAGFVLGSVGYMFLFGGIYCIISWVVTAIATGCVISKIRYI